MESLKGRSRENAMGDERDHIGGTSFFELVRRHNERAASVGHVVNKHGGLAGDLADQDHACDLVGLLAFFVEESEIQI